MFWAAQKRLVFWYLSQDSMFAPCVKRMSAMDALFLAAASINGVCLSKSSVFTCFGSLLCKRCVDRKKMKMTNWWTLKKLWDRIHNLPTLISRSIRKTTARLIELSVADYARLREIPLYTIFHRWQFSPCYFVMFIYTRELKICDLIHGEIKFNFWVIYTDSVRECKFVQRQIAEG